MIRNDSSFTSILKVIKLRNVEIEKKILNNTQK